MSLFSTFVKFTVAHLAILNWALVQRVLIGAFSTAEITACATSPAVITSLLYTMTCSVLISYICSHIAFV